MRCPMGGLIVQCVVTDVYIVIMRSKIVQRVVLCYNAMSEFIATMVKPIGGFIAAMRSAISGLIACYNAQYYNYNG